MHPVNFEGATEVKKPDNMTDEQCSSIWADHGTDVNGFPFYMTAWQPNKEDLEALNDGMPIYVKTICHQLPPMALFTINKNGHPNF